jgi:hypothetical protein
MNLTSYIGPTILAFAIGFASNAQSISQSPTSTQTGKLTGYTLDSHKSSVAAAKIIVESKGFRREAISDEEGHYEIDLPEGKYKVRAEHAWFYPTRWKSVRVSSGVTAHLDITFKVGKSADESHP